MLNYGWIIPVIPAVSFFLILLVGKRMPKQGSEIGILAVGSSFLLSCVAVYQWIQRVDDATGGSSSAWFSSSLPSRRKQTTEKSGRTTTSHPGVSSTQDAKSWASSYRSRARPSLPRI